MLPEDGTECESKASFKDGALEVHLKKSKAGSSRRIVIE